MDSDDLPAEELQRIAAGNLQYESVFGNNGQNASQLGAIDNNVDGKDDGKL